MEILIIVCFLIIIILLTIDKVIVVRKEDKKTHKPSFENTDLPHIMGVPKKISGQLKPNNAKEGQIHNMLIDEGNFESTTKEGLYVGTPQEEPDKIIEDSLDLVAEEEEWESNREPNGDDGFATGVSFEELISLKDILQEKDINAEQGLKAVEIVQKLQGTELFALLESSIEGASSKIAVLLDRTLAQSSDSGSSNLRRQDLNDFDITEFL